MLSTLKNIAFLVEQGGEHAHPGLGEHAARWPSGTAHT